MNAIESPVGAEVVIDGRRYINFGGSSYLGMAGSAALIESGVAALRRWGGGNPVSRGQQLVTRAHRDVEMEAAAFFGAPSALFLPSGYFFGLIAVAVLREKVGVILFDESSHYSLREAIAASGIQSHSYRHMDAGHLSEKLRSVAGYAGVPLVATDGLFPALGEIAPLGALNEAVKLYGGLLLVDESHSFGVLGASGQGALAHHGIDSGDAITGGSLAKAFGACGGIILGNESDVVRMGQTPAAIGASSGIPAAAAMCASSLRYVREHPELLKRLRKNVSRMKGGLRALGLDIDDTVAPIAAFVSGSMQSMQSLKRDLMAEGIIVYYTSYVGTGAAGVIRCGIFADHTTEQVDKLLDTLRRLL